MTQTISTIVDKFRAGTHMKVYMTQTISTIVDCMATNCTQVVYMTQTISTIVDNYSTQIQLFGLYDPNNFYYCR